jgi:hypothetical protein
MNADSLAHARFLLRRLRRRVPRATIILGLWTYTPENMARRDPIEATGADRVVTSIKDALGAIIAELAPVETCAANTPILSLAAAGER